MEPVKWYQCKRDIIVTLCLVAFTFFCLPLIITGWHDYWLMVALFIVLLTFIESLLICQHHFWIWISIATFGINISCFWPISISLDNLVSLLVEWVMCFVIAFPLVIFSRMFSSTIPKGPYLLLWPIGWFVGYCFRDLNPNIDGPINNIMISTLVVSIVIFCVAAYLFYRTDKKNKRLLLQWISVFLWLPVGLVPGIMGFGWKYSLFATILPVSVIYWFFEVSKKAIEKANNREETICLKG